MKEHLPLLWVSIPRVYPVIAHDKRNGMDGVGAIGVSVGIEEAAM
jgi:hypothetical protein